MELKHTLQYGGLIRRETETTKDGLTLVDSVECEWHDENRHYLLVKSLSGESERTYSPAIYIEQVALGEDQRRFVTWTPTRRALVCRSNGAPVGTSEGREYDVIRQLLPGEKYSHEIGYRGDMFFCVERAGAYDTLDDINIIIKTETETEIKSLDIEEPIGYDDFAVQYKRGDFHGMSIGVSEQSLEFYGEAAELIDRLRREDIDNRIVYTIRDLSGQRDVYRGLLDLTTIKVNRSDYKSISCKVGDIGAKTTFNLRSDVDVDLLTNETIDGSELLYAPTWIQPLLPAKHLMYTDSAERNADTQGVISVNRSGWINLRIGEPEVEFGNLETAEDYDTVWLDNDCASFYDPSEDHEEEYGIGTMAHVELVFRMKYETGGDPEELYLYPSISGSAPAVSGEYIAKGDIVTVRLEGDFPADEKIFFGLRCYKNAQFQNSSLNVRVYSGSYVKITMLDTKEYSGVYPKVIPIYDALMTIAGAISENGIGVRSGFYSKIGRSWSGATGFGDGALKAITSGNMIRGLYSDSYKERNMPVSFKTLMKSLLALDCAGFGFSNEDGDDFVRVERWDWFYKDDLIASFDGVHEVTTNFNDGVVPTVLNFGYKQFEGDGWQSTDSVHGERQYVSSIKALSTEYEQLCELIADNYAIEVQRRAKFDNKSNESGPHDEDLFVLELKATVGDGNETTYEVANNVVEANNVDRVGECINVQLSPRRCAERWRDYIFTAANKNDIKFTSGKINYRAEFKCHQSEGNVHYLKDYAGGEMLAENADISYVHAKFDAETIEFECPVTLDQYKAITSNPYGLISVNGMLGWVRDFKYKFNESIGNFTLIKKHE